MMNKKISTKRPLVFLTVLVAIALSWAQSVLVLRANGKPFEEALQGITDEIGGEMQIHDMVVGREMTQEQIGAKLREVNPNAVVLMDNVAIGLYKKYQSSVKDSGANRPSISCMGVFVGMAIADLKNACAVTYEVPIVTSLVSLRSLTGSASLRVGIIHREFLRGFVTENTQYCKRENIQIVSTALSNQEPDFRKAVRKALENLLRKEKINALWISNDNMLLQADIISEVWIPLIAKYPVPVVVGVEGLVDPRVDLGVFAVLPDHMGIGSQIAQKLFEARDAGWKWDSDRTQEPPLSIYKIVNLKKAKSLFPIAPSRLDDIDKIRQ